MTAPDCSVPKISQLAYPKISGVEYCVVRFCKSKTKRMTVKTSFLKKHRCPGRIRTPTYWTKTSCPAIRRPGKQTPIRKDPKDRDVSRSNQGGFLFSSPFRHAGDLVSSLSMPRAALCAWTGTLVRSGPVCWWLSADPQRNFRQYKKFRQSNRPVTLSRPLGDTTPTVLPSGATETPEKRTSPIESD